MISKNSNMSYTFVISFIFKLSDYYQVTTTIHEGLKIVKYNVINKIFRS